MCVSVCVYLCVHMGTCGCLLFVSSVSVSPLLTLSPSFCNVVLSALMTHISYLQSLHNPSSAGSGTDYCSQTPEEMRAEQGGGWGVERDASVIQSRGPVCTHIHLFHIFTAENPQICFSRKYTITICFFLVL